MIARIGVAAALLAVIAANGELSGQAQFEAASIKRVRTSNQPPVVAVRSNRLIAPFVTARELVRLAYGAEEMRVLGGPDWIDRDRFEVMATITGDATVTRAREMLRALLADRFQMAAHHEMRELPVYALGFARADRRLGDGMRPAAAECAPMKVPTGPGTPPPPPPPPPGSGPPPLLLNQPIVLRCPTMFAPGYVSARAVPLSLLLWQLRDEVRRPVIDRTGLDGDFDVDLYYMPEVLPRLGAIGPADAPSIFSAVRDQIGLKLEATRAAIDVIVIDRIEPPTEN